MTVVRIVSWNIGGREEPWRQIAANDSIDVALLQEAKAPPPGLRLEVVGVEGAWQTSGWEKRYFRTAVVRCSDCVEVIAEPAVRPVGLAGPGDLAVSRPGTLAVAKVVPPNGQPFTVASVYAAWERPVPYAPDGWIYGDASAHRLVSDLSALVATQSEHRILVAGDWNILHGYGEGGSPYWGARYKTVFERLETIGLRFVGPQQPSGVPASPRPGELPSGSKDVPTYRTNATDSASGQRQLDFVFASVDLSDQVVKVAALNSPGEWGASDHCRVMIDIVTG
jgi:exonuclease III